MSKAARQQRLNNVEAIAKRRREATHCKRGHPYTEENTYVVPSTGRRSCRTCKADADYYRHQEIRRLNK